jgi:hypothetical protein
MYTGLVGNNKAKFSDILAKSERSPFLARRGGCGAAADDEMDSSW